MDIEFINAYIAKQKALIDDFQARVLVLEVKHSLLEKQYESVFSELETLKSKKSTKQSTE
jgi:hypothetical protein